MWRDLVGEVVGEGEFEGDVVAQNATCRRAVPLGVKAHGAQSLDELFPDFERCLLAFLHGGESKVQLAVVDNPADVLAVAVDIPLRPSSSASSEPTQTPSDRSHASLNVKEISH